MIDSALLVGRPEEMGDFILTLLQRVRTARFLSRIEDLEQVTEAVSLMIVLQHWSDEFSPETIRFLLETYPLSRFIVVQGDWCASDRRTRGNWPAAFCVPVSEAIRRLDREIEVLAGRRPPLPWTAGMDEIFAFDHA